MKSEFVCARCGLTIQYWYFGWKHSGGWRTQPSCGQKPIPVRRSDYVARQAAYEAANARCPLPINGTRDLT
jgi:hypothetical protein